MSDLECTSDDMWPTLLLDVLEYVTLLTNLELEGSAPSVPTLTRKEIIEHATTRKESRAAAKAAGGAAQGKAPPAGERKSEPFVGSLIPWHHCHGGAWNETL